MKEREYLDVRLAITGADLSELMNNEYVPRMSARQ